MKEDRRTKDKGFNWISGSDLIPNQVSEFPDSYKMTSVVRGEAWLVRPNLICDAGCILINAVKCRRESLCFFAWNAY